MNDDSLALAPERIQRFLSRAESHYGNSYFQVLEELVQSLMREEGVEAMRCADEAVIFDYLHLSPQEGSRLSFDELDVLIVDAKAKEAVEINHAGPEAQARCILSLGDYGTDEPLSSVLEDMDQIITKSHIGL